MPLSAIRLAVGLYSGPWLEGLITHALAEEGCGVKLVTGKCIVYMGGPPLSTQAESYMYRQWGGDLINMSVLPEAKLVHEAEVRYSALRSSTLLLRLLIENFFDDDSYALIATVTDYDPWRPIAEAVTAAGGF